MSSRRPLNKKASHSVNVNAERVGMRSKLLLLACRHFDDRWPWENDTCECPVGGALRVGLSSRSVVLRVYTDRFGRLQRVFFLFVPVKQNGLERRERDAT